MPLAYPLAPEENLAVVMNRPREAPLPESAPTNAWMLGMEELNAWMRWFRSGRTSQALGWLTLDERRLALGYAV